ncbi:MAG: efflux RND transporter periplasmic adaptor subunit [Proteobacteria bacterium]|nr:efflux RND transporter periplasmic adaptor subunit [Pseudomonadota bacterium]MBU1060219.1 efflux RND transporter periplasmic adaptor subunit [Pseudomonadota bacterium]
MRLLLVLLSFCSLPLLLQAQEPPPTSVVVTEVVRETIAETQSVIGILVYDRTSEVSTEVTGLVQEVLVRAGDHVEEGDVLVRLDTKLLDSDISLKKTRIAQNDLRQQNTEKNFKRLQALYKESGVSEKDFDDALYTFQDAKLEKQARQEELAGLLIKRERSVIRAPFNGVILSKEVDSGAWVQQGKMLVSLGSSDDLFVRAPIGESLLRYLKKGQPLTVTLNAFEEKIEGVVEDIDPVADVKTKNIFVKIRIPAQEIVAANMSATVHLPASTEKELSIIPRAALIKFQGKDFIYTVKEDKAAILPVNIVAFMGDRVGVDNPYISAGMVVVIEGNERLRPDQAVQVAGEK